ncbi:MAG: CBS domain-containing protein, partial [Flavobacteriales bacterium]
AHGLLPLIGACTAAYLVSFFLLKGGSLYTEKLERLGIHTPSALEPDILQKLLVRDVLEDGIHVLSDGITIGEARQWIKEHAADEGAVSFVVVDKDKRLIGLVRRRDIFGKQFEDSASIRSIVLNDSIQIYPGNELSYAIEMMDKFQTSVVPVVRRGSDKVVGVLTHKAIFAAYRRRRNEDEVYQMDISLRRQGIRIIESGRQLLRWDRDKD